MECINCKSNLDWLYNDNVRYPYAFLPFVQCHVAMKTVKEIPKAQENQAPCGIFLSVARVNIIPNKMRIQIQNAISIPPKTNANKSGQIHDSLQQKCTTAVIREVVMSMTVATTS